MQQQGAVAMGTEEKKRVRAFLAEQAMQGCTFNEAYSRAQAKYGSTVTRQMIGGMWSFAMQDAGVSPKRKKPSRKKNGSIPPATQPGLSSLRRSSAKENDGVTVAGGTARKLETANGPVAKKKKERKHSATLLAGTSDELAVDILVTLPARIAGPLDPLIEALSTLQECRDELMGLGVDAIMTVNTED